MQNVSVQQRRVRGDNAFADRMLEIEKKYAAQLAGKTTAERILFIMERMNK